jgi:hypothetical protein
MRTTLWMISSWVWISAVSAQSIDSTINLKEVTRIERTLSADDMQGRAVFTPGIEKAASFIGSEFKKAGLETLGSGDYKQPFEILETQPTTAGADLDQTKVTKDQIVAFSSEEVLDIDPRSGYKTTQIKRGDDFRTLALQSISSRSNLLVWVDTSFGRRFAKLAQYSGKQFKKPNSVVFVLTSLAPTSFHIHLEQRVTESKLANLVGVLKGTTRKDEYVIFSAHYDHLGIGEPDAKQDSIFNGANDDASGTTAVIMLAKYFSAIKTNGRTLLFVCFTAEEIGEYGSEYFSGELDPPKVQAMFNIEMIGTQSKWGINSAYITGYEKTDMGKILEKNLRGSRFRFYPDPYPDQGLFYRSDNASLAKKGVPAHTISTSKMDSEKYYHTAGDEIGTLDLSNMTQIIKAIAQSSRSIVAGTDTPTRVETSALP